MVQISKAIRVFHPCSNAIVRVTTYFIRSYTVVLFLQHSTYHFRDTKRRLFVKKKHILAFIFREKERKRKRREK